MEYDRKQHEIWLVWQWLVNEKEWQLRAITTSRELAEEFRSRLYNQPTRLKHKVFIELRKANHLYGYFESRGIKKRSIKEAKGEEKCGNCLYWATKSFDEFKVCCNYFSENQGLPTEEHHTCDRFRPYLVKG
jgi:hypothetical protein